MSWLKRAVRRTVLVVLLCCLWVGCNLEPCEDVDCGGRLLTPFEYWLYQLWLTTIRLPSGNPGMLMAEGDPYSTQAFPLGIRLLEFGPRAMSGAAREIALQVQSAGIVVHYPGGALGRLSGQLLANQAGGGNTEPLLYISNWPGNNVLEFDPATRRTTNTIPSGRGPAGIVMSPRGERLFVALQDAAGIAVIDREARQRIDTIPIAGSEPFGLGITPDGERLLACDINGGGRVHIVDIQTQQILQTLQTGELPEQIAVNPEGSLAYVTASRGGRTTIIDLTSNQALGRLNTPDAVGVVLDPSGDRVYVAHSQRRGLVSAFDIFTNRKVAEWSVGVFPEFLHFAPDPRYLFVANSESDFLTVIDLVEDRTEDIPARFGLGPMAIVPIPEAAGALDARRSAE